MAHNSLIRNPVTGWSQGSTVLASELEQLEANLVGAIDGDGGGCWAPPSAIIIGGSGLQVSGPTVVARGGTLTTANASGSIQFAGGVFPQLGPGHAGRSRKFLIPFAEARAVPRYMWRPRRDSGAMQSIAPMLLPWNAAAPTPATLLLRIRAHQGATLSRVTIGFRVSPHASLPQTMPSARVLRVSKDGTTAALTSTAAGANALGFVYVPAPASVSAYYQGGAAQTLVIPCDQNNTVDRTTYAYLVEVVDEQWPASSGYPGVAASFQPVRAAANNYTFAAYGGFPVAIYPNGLPTLDGVALADGDRVLLMNMPQPTFNGLWTAHSGAWTRAPDLAAASQFEQGMIVRVQQGNTYGGSLWQVPGSTTSWDPGTMDTQTPTWMASVNTTGVGMPMQPTAAHYNGYWYTVGSSSTSPYATGSTEPAWPTSIGSTVNDGTVTWVCAGKAPTLLPFVTRGDADAPAVGSAIVPQGNVFQAALVEFDGITSMRWA